MTKEELRAKYARVPTDFSQIALLKDQLIESGLLDVAQINPENAGKALVFNDDGTLTVGEVSGGNKYIELDFGNTTPTFGDLAEAVEWTEPYATGMTANVDIQWRSSWPYRFRGTATLGIHGSLYMSFTLPIGLEGYKEYGAVITGNDMSLETYFADSNIYANKSFVPKPTAADKILKTNSYMEMKWVDASTTLYCHNIRFNSYPTKHYVEETTIDYANNTSTTSYSEGSLPSFADKSMSVISTRSDAVTSLGILLEPMKICQYMTVTYETGTVYDILIINNLTVQQGALVDVLITAIKYDANNPAHFTIHKFVQPVACTDTVTVL